MAKIESRVGKVLDNLTKDGKVKNFSFSNEELNKAAKNAEKIKIDYKRKNANSERLMRDTILD